MNIDELILIKEKELKQLKKEQRREQDKEIIQTNIKKSKEEKEYIKLNFKEHTKEKVFKYFNQMPNEIFRFCSELVWDEELEQFYFMCPALHKNTKILINKDYGKHKIYNFLNHEAEKFEIRQKKNPRLTKAVLARKLISDNSPEEFEIVEEDLSYFPTLTIAYKDRKFLIKFSSIYQGPNTSQKSHECYEVMLLSLSNDYKSLGKFRYILDCKTKIFKTGNNPIELIKEITEDIETIKELFSSEKAKN